MQPRLCYGKANVDTCAARHDRKDGKNLKTPDRFEIGLYKKHLMYLGNKMFRLQSCQGSLIKTECYFFFPCRWREKRNLSYGKVI